MWPDNWIADASKVDAMLKAWRGGMAQAWAYSVSHSQLLIRVHREKNPVEVRSLFIYIKGCMQISFQSSWRDVAFVIKEIGAGSGSEYEVSDADRCIIRCSVRPFVCEMEGYDVKLPGI
jgi:hypothetical protein